MRSYVVMLVTTSASILAACGTSTDAGPVIAGDVPQGTPRDSGPSLSGPYEGCTEGQICGEPTRCATSSFTRTGGTGSFCTAACSASEECPANSLNPAFPPFCVPRNSGAPGQCYATCQSTADCRGRTVCALAAGTGTDVCVPAGTGTITPMARAYDACSPVGLSCGSSTMCTRSTIERAGAAQGNFCTLACVRGFTAMCPGHVPGASAQSVACVAPVSGSEPARCMRRCNPANGNRDCNPFSTFCTSITSADGAIDVCVP